MFVKKLKQPQRFLNKIRIYKRFLRKIKSKRLIIRQFYYLNCKSINFIKFLKLKQKKFKNKRFQLTGKIKTLYKYILRKKQILLLESFISKFFLKKYYLQNTKKNYKYTYIKNEIFEDDTDKYPWYSEEEFIDVGLFELPVQLKIQKFTNLQLQNINKKKRLKLFRKLLKIYWKIKKLRIKIYGRKLKTVCIKKPRFHRKLIYSIFRWSPLFKNTKTNIVKNKLNIFTSNIYWKPSTISNLINNTCAKSFYRKLNWDLLDIKKVKNLKIVNNSKLYPIELKNNSTITKINYIENYNQQLLKKTTRVIKSLNNLGFLKRHNKKFFVLFSKTKMIKLIIRYLLKLFLTSYSFNNISITKFYEKIINIISKISVQRQNKWSQAKFNFVKFWKISIVNNIFSRLRVESVWHWLPFKIMFQKQTSSGLGQSSQYLEKYLLYFLNQRDLFKDVNTKFSLLRDSKFKLTMNTKWTDEEQLYSKWIHLKRDTHIMRYLKFFKNLKQINLNTIEYKLIYINDVLVKYLKKNSIKNIFDNVFLSNYALSSYIFKIYEGIKQSEKIKKTKQVRKRTYFLNFWQRKLNVFKKARTVHWRLYEKKKTLKARRYKIFYKPFLKHKNYQQLFIANFFSVKFNLSMSFWKTFTSLYFFFLNKIINCKYIYQFPISTLFWLFLEKNLNTRKKLKYKIDNWLIKRKQVKKRFWMQPKKKIPNIFYKQNFFIEKLFNHIQYDYITNYICVLKENKTIITLNNLVYKNKMLKLNDFRYKA